MLSTSECEKRSCPRYPFKDIAYIILNTGNIMVGQLVDLSRGGLGFSYIGTNLVKEKETSLDIFLYNMDIYMKRLPVSIIHNFPLTESVYNPALTMMRCGIRFRDLPKKQAEQLHCIIRSLED